MKKPESVEGGCLCGATRFRAVGQPYKVTYCHCKSCRRATGAPVAAWLMYDRGQIEFTRASPRKYQSSPGVLRGFCPLCGTPLWWEGIWDGKPIQMVTSGSLDDPEPYPPDRHASCESRIGWFDVADNLPRYPQASPAT